MTCTDGLSHALVPWYHMDLVN